MKEFITTDQAPAAIGTYSQAVPHRGTLYISGQIPLDPETMEIVADDFRQQISQVLDNLDAICRAAEVSLNDVIKFTVYLTELDNFPLVNEAMQTRLSQPFPARAVVEVSALPKGVAVEIDAVVDLTP
ncbi:MAG TPA: Rid family detoxifying hydrolase [Pseudomonadales bacterium]|jgi:reactive intermediate/imine deaminase|nr:reactive intermediate/imine deaminase [Gammaproteobacteria bacterium]MDP6027409.1 Rid family detoxifying hydrolase [Pseudomonadales bacterium]MDP6315105.1 Rid family detoxifying hydrolase [Pseudomonadales bacterium]MDP7315883.1 Rid family detoxifying hydrolase [Pseudomonadales bacterium]HJL60448.1 Rid family detoxifying hydrolase [Pseudomonadales bacterium]|tara:strand:- start:1416 stop:1799 length:384 start_codon:yes stop_codon:yes gene_type:complete